MLNEPFGPSSLDAIERRFTELTGQTQKDPLSLDGSCLGPEFPNRLVPLDEARTVLLKRKTSWRTKNEVWQELTRRAQEIGAPWTIGALGVALPGLKAISGRTVLGRTGDIADLESEIIEGFLSALDRIEPESTCIYPALTFAAERSGKQARADANRNKSVGTDFDERIMTEYQPNRIGHPDLLLAEAVRGNHLSEEEAGLISRAKLDRHGSTRTAEELGLSPYLFRRKMERAQERLLEYLTEAVPNPAI